MEIVQILRDLIALRDIVVILVSGAGHGKSLAETLGLLEGFLGPDTGLEITGLVLQEIHGNIKELEAGAAAQEDDLVAFGNVQDLFPERATFVHRFIPALGAVGDRKKGDTGALEILQGLDGVVDDRLRKYAGASVEDMFFTHYLNMLNQPTKIPNLSILSKKSCSKERRIRTSREHSARND